MQPSRLAASAVSARCGRLQNLCILSICSERAFVQQTVSLVPYQTDHRNVCLTCNPLYKNSSTARLRRLLLPAMLLHHWSRRTDTGYERIVLTRRLQLLLNPVVGQAVSVRRCSLRTRMWNRRVRTPPTHMNLVLHMLCLLYTSPSPRDGLLSRMPSSA